MPDLIGPVPCQIVCRSLRIPVSVLYQFTQCFRIIQFRIIPTILNNFEDFIERSIFYKIRSCWSQDLKKRLCHNYFRDKKIALDTNNYLRSITNHWSQMVKLTPLAVLLSYLRLVVKRRDLWTCFQFASCWLVSRERRTRTTRWNRLRSTQQPRLCKHVTALEKEIIKINFQINWNS